VPSASRHTRTVHGANSPLLNQMQRPTGGSGSVYAGHKPVAARSRPESVPSRDWTVRDLAGGPLPRAPRGQLPVPVSLFPMILSKARESPVVHAMRSLQTAKAPHDRSKRNSLWGSCRPGS
jgi:hypothetical protein